MLRYYDYYESGQEVKLQMIIPCHQDLGLWI